MGRRVIIDYSHRGGSPASPHPSASVDIVRLGRFVGSGKLGSVYEVTVHISGKENDTDYLAKESNFTSLPVSAMARLNACPFVINYLGYGQHLGKTYIVFERVPQEVVTASHHLLATITTLGAICRLLLKYLDAFECIVRQNLSGIDIDSVRKNSFLMLKDGEPAPILYDLDGLAPVDGSSGTHEYRIIGTMLLEFLKEGVSSSSHNKDALLRCYTHHFQPQLHRICFDRTDDPDEIRALLSECAPSEVPLPLDLSVTWFVEHLDIFKQIQRDRLYLVNGTDHPILLHAKANLPPKEGSVEFTAFSFDREVKEVGEHRLVVTVNRSEWTVHPIIRTTWRRSPCTLVKLYPTL